MTNYDETLINAIINRFAPEFASARDKAAMITYLFDEAKNQFLHALAKGELEQLIYPKKPIALNFKGDNQ